MQVAMLLGKSYPPDIRVRKEVSALRDAGHDVVVVAEYDGDEPLRETTDEADVVRIDAEPSRLDMVKYNLTFVYRHRYDALAEVVERRDVGAVHAHDLRMVPTGMAVAREYNLPIIADLHENYPEAVRQWRSGRSSKGELVQRVLRPIRRYKRLERRCVHRADEVVTVVEEGKAHYIDDCGADPDSVTVVSNTVDLEAYDAIPRTAVDVEGDPILTYVGGFGPHRGLESAIRALPDIHEFVPDATLLLVGSGGDRYTEQLRDLCTELDVEDAVVFTGWVDFEHVPSYLDASDVCLVLHTKNPHTESTIPHKLFQYMASRTPVVASDVAPLKRVVTETDAGLVTDGTPSSVADAIRDVVGSEQRIEELGKNGRHAVESTYNWERDAKRLTRLYDSLDR